MPGRVMVNAAAACQAGGGHFWSPEVDQDGRAVLDEPGGSHAPGQFVQVCPRCLVVQVRVYGAHGCAEFNYVDYDNMLRAALGAAMPVG